MSAKIYDVREYRCRKALRDCGRDSRPRSFVWIDPRSGRATVAMFQPARPTAAMALGRAMGGRPG